LLCIYTRSQAWGLSAQYSGCKAMAFTPRCTYRYLRSCSLGRASFPSSGLPFGWTGPVQNTSADAAARGQIMLSILDGSDCSVHKSCWPPSTRLASVSVRLAFGSKEYAYSPLDMHCRYREGAPTFCQVLNGSHQEFPFVKLPAHAPCPQS
jgi:hypothetical protein